MKHLKKFNEMNSTNTIIKSIGSDRTLIDGILEFKYKKLIHVYDNKEDSDSYTLSVTNFDNSYVEIDSDGNTNSIFLTSNNDIIDEIEWYDENSGIEFLNNFDYETIKKMGTSIELVTFLGDDINIYYKFFTDYDYIWAQYFTDSEKVDMDKSICKTIYNNRELVITIKHKY